MSIHTVRRHLEDFRDPTPCSSSEGVLKVSDLFRQYTGYTDEKLTLISEQIVCSLFFSQCPNRFYLLLMGEFNKHTCTPEWA